MADNFQLNTFANVNPPWSLPQLDANFQALSTALVKRDPAVTDPVYGAIGDGIVANEIPNIQAALNANRGRDVLVPSGVYNGTQPLLIGGPLGTDYNSLLGQGPPIYSNNSPTHPRSILNFTTGSGVLINNSYQRLETMALIGTSAGGSNPATGTLAALKNIGLTLSGGAFHGGYSHIRGIAASGFDTGIAVPPSGFMAYAEIENVDAFSCVTGWALIGSITDMHIRGGKTIDCSGRGMYLSGAARVTVSEHTFELSGSAAPNKSSAAACVEDEAQLHLIGCGLQDATCYYAGRAARIEFTDCNPTTALHFFGPGEFIFNNSLGRAIDIPVPAPSTWTLTNCTCVAVSTSTYPASYQVQSTSPAGTLVQMASVIPVASWGLGLAKASISYDPAETVRNYLAWEFELQFDQTVPPPDITAADGFLPLLIVRAFDASADSFSIAIDTDKSAWNFTDKKKWRFNAIMPITWGGAGLMDTIKEAEVRIQFTNSLVPAYNVNALNCIQSKHKLTFFQRNVTTV